jgi:hypothetical protein
MFGGVAVLSAWGLLLWPLLARLGVEAVMIARDEGMNRDAGAEPSTAAW